jgi:molybdopterin converting factor small subunit
MAAETSNVSAGPSEDPLGQAASTGDAGVRLELHGFLGRRRGTRTIIALSAAASGATVAAVLTTLVAADQRYSLLFDAESQALPEHVEAVLNDRVLDLQGGLAATLTPGDVLTFLPAHAGGQ